MARENPRRQIDRLAREAERALTAQRESSLPTDQELTDRATVRRSDVDSAVVFGRMANAGQPLERLLDGPAGESEQNG